MGDIDMILAARHVTHGDFATHAVLSQRMKEVIHGSPNWDQLPPIMREALDMVLHKVARIMNGNPRHIDHWDDIAGYAKLVADDLRRIEKELEVMDIDFSTKE